MEATTDWVERIDALIEQAAVLVNADGVDAGIRALGEALSILDETAGAQSHLVFARLLCAQGDIALGIGDGHSAAPLFARALEVVEDNGEAGLSQLPYTLIELARADALCGRVEQARNGLTRALSIIDEQFDGPNCREVREFVVAKLIELDVT